MHNELVNAVAVEVGARNSGDAGAAGVAVGFAGPGMRHLEHLPVEDAATNLVPINLSGVLFEFPQIVHTQGLGGACGDHLGLAR